MDYYSTISAQETQQTKNNLLNLTVSCEKSCLIRIKKVKNKWINNNNNNNNNNKNEIKRKDKRKRD